MTTGTGPRYAIYYAPEPGSPLDTFGRSWFGNSANGRPPGANAKLGPNKIAALSESSRRYGLHGTLKPPFALNPGTTSESLLEAARVFARSLTPVEIPPLELVTIAKFIALSPTTQSAALEKLSAACVRGFEAYRGPLSNEQVENYRFNKLTVHQEQMLHHWGYPYVMEEFRFHISVTDPIDDPKERQEAMTAIETLAAPVLGKASTIRELTLFSQPGLYEPMVAMERIPFGRDA